MIFDEKTAARIQRWLNGAYDEETKAEIRKLEQNDPAALRDAFISDLSFGTGGMRSLMGVGTDRINRYTIAMATQGLAQYILKNRPIEGRQKVLVGYDARVGSREFAEIAARVFAGNGIEVLLLEEIRPTPFISFGCREKKCSAAVMITASHNSAEYNGYKVYWSDGGQVVSPHDTGIVEEVHHVQMIEQVRFASVTDPLIEHVGAELDQKYYEAIRPLQRHPETNKNKGSMLSITYTSLHGVGITLAPTALKDWGFTEINLVPEQVIPDGHFPTIKYPNPEYPESLKLGVAHMMSTKSDLLLANDADADRLGVVVLHQGKPIQLNGNQIAAICTEYLFSTSKTAPRAAVVTTIVTTDLLRAIATSHHRPCIEVLTGFKYIGEKIHDWEMNPNGYLFLFGAEESYGFLLGTHSRDKDAIVSGNLIAEIALQAKLKQKTLIDLLFEIYQKYGVFREKQFSISFSPGKEGMDGMKKLMDRLRHHLPTTIGKKSVVTIEDYFSLTRHELITGKVEKLTLPQSDVLLFRLADESKLVIRPSGTEPKIKIYASVQRKVQGAIEKEIAHCDLMLEQLIETITNELKK